VREHGAGHRHVDGLSRRARDPLVDLPDALPVEPCRRSARARDPVQRDHVEDLVARLRGRIRQIQGRPPVEQDHLDAGLLLDRELGLEVPVAECDRDDRAALDRRTGDIRFAPEAEQQERYVDCGLALSPADCGPDAAGKIALIERGGTPFTAKAASAEAAGAIAAIIYNDEPGNFAGTLIVVEPGIPVAAMSQEDGHALLEHVEGGVSTIELALTWGDPFSIEGQLSGFSSRGPNDDWMLKPDIVAPGNNITAPVPRAGQLASVDGYADAGGTSMSAPHISGIAALLAEAHPDWTPQMAKTAIMNTAVQLTDPETGDLYSVLDQGAGLVVAEAAVNTPALIG
jgi:hypothetical protein